MEVREDPSIRAGRLVATTGHLFLDWKIAGTSSDTQRSEPSDGSEKIWRVTTSGQSSGFQEKCWSAEGGRDSLPLQPFLFQG